MEINKKNRAELKNFFEANKIPTQRHFADFVEAGLNQAEDGIAKVQGSPLALQAEGETIGTQEVLNLFSNFANENPEWSLNLNPRVVAEESDSNQSGFNIKDAIGQSRLFIRSRDGSIGIGTIEPEARLTIQGTGNGSLIVVSDTEQPSHIFEVTQEAGNGMLSLRGEDTTLGVRLSGAIEKPSFFLGNVGIGTENPEAPLQVSGENAELRIDNTGTDNSTETRLRLNHSGSSKSWELFVKKGLGNLEFISDEEDSKRFIMRNDGSLTVPGGVWVGANNRPDHLEADGSLYKHNDQVHLTVDDAFYIRKKGNGIKMHFDTNAGRMGIGTSNASAPLSIGGSGKDSHPDASMHITNQSILFGGNNAGKQFNSAKISAGTHVSNSLCIVGMASGTSNTDRKVDIFAEGGLTIRGSLHVNDYIYHTKPVMFVAYLGSHKSGNVGILNFNKISHNLGNAYNAGVFTAPVKGVYMFTITLRPGKTVQWKMNLDPVSGAANTFVNANNQGETAEKAGLIVGNPHHGSKTIFTELNTGDKVFISQTASSSAHADNYSSSFEGMLMYALP